MRGQDFLRIEERSETICPPPSMTLGTSSGGRYKVKTGRAIHSFTRRSRRAFEITETELKVMAALAMIGLSSKPKNG
jgi:hypothetical protein